MVVWARRRAWLIAAGLAAVLLLMAATAVGRQSLFGAPPNTGGEIGPKFRITSNGRWLHPAGRLTMVGNFPTGGALTPDGRFYWVVDSGYGKDAVQIIQVSTGKIIETLALPGAYGGIAFSKDGTHAYVSGEPEGITAPLGPVKAPNGDAIHVYDVNVHTGHATEGNPIMLPKLPAGNNQSAGEPTDWPEGLAVSPDGKTLVVALNDADSAAIVNLQTQAVTTVKVGEFPSWVAIDPKGQYAYVTNEYDGTVSKIDLATATVTDTIPVGGKVNPDGQADANKNAHPESLVIDPSGQHVYVPDAERDLVATIDTATDKVSYTSVQRGPNIGAEPVAVALSPDGQRLYVADENEDDVSVIDLGTHRLIGRVPTASFPTAVSVTPRNQLVWVAGKGFGTGPNPGYFGTPAADSGAAPYGQYDLDMELGQVGVLDAPTGTTLASDTRVADSQMIPANFQPPPSNTVIRPNGPIKHVFLIVKENRTYDQLFGTEGARGEGDPALEVFDDNGVKGPTGGITPNQHALARQFGLLDNFYGDSDTSVDGHEIVIAGIASDWAVRANHANYSNRGRNENVHDVPVAEPPRDYIYDQAVRQHISFRDYGDEAAKTVINDGRPTFAGSVANRDASYPDNIGCTKAPANNQNCDWDHGTIGTGPGQQQANSRFDTFEAEFDQQVKTNSVPTLNTLWLPNDHTNGTGPGLPTPSAEVADNDLGLGQVVQLISHSKIWKSSAIFVEEDDSQDGADHVDAHRMPAFVISPYSKHGNAVISTRYDQDSMLRTIEIITGLKPLGIDDAVATPMYDAFTTHPNLSTYTAIQPQYPLNAVNSANAPDAKLSEAMPWHTVDAVPQAISDKIIWQSVHGANSTPPPPGPNASSDEQARAVTAMAAYDNHQNVGEALNRAGMYIDNPSGGN